MGYTTAGAMIVAFSSQLCLCFSVHKSLLDITMLHIRQLGNIKPQKLHKGKCQTCHSLVANCHCVKRAQWNLIEQCLEPIAKD